MKDNDLLAFISELLNDAMSHAGVTPEVTQKPSPDQQGTSDKPTVYFERMFDIPYGFGQVGSQHQSSSRDFAKKETQVVLTHIHISARFRQDPSNLSLPTPVDLIEHVNMYLKARPTLARFRAKELSIFRVKDIQNDKFENDKEQFESFPGLELVICHNRDITFEVPAVYKLEPKFVKSV